MENIACPMHARQICHEPAEPPTLMPPRAAAAKPPAPALPSYAEATSRTALSLIVAEARDEDAESSDRASSFEAIERSASEALLDVFTRFLRTVGGAARTAAQHAGRSESNLADLIAAIEAVSPDGAGLSIAELRSFVEEAPEVAFPHNVSAFPVPRAPLSAAAAAATPVSADPRPIYVPDFLPPFPEKRMYSHTATHNSRAADAQAAKKRRAKNRRHAQDSLLNLTDAARASNGGVGASGALPAGGPPPPPLPAMPAAGNNGGSVAAASFGDEGGGGASALSSVPDMLVPSMPAVLQSSARLETSGFVDAPAFGAPPPSAAGSDAADAAAAAKAAVASASERHQAILQLKHLHGLDVLNNESRGRRGANREDDDFDE